MPFSDPDARRTYHRELVARLRERRIAENPAYRREEYQARKITRRNSYGNATKPFRGVDGEGGGVNEFGQQNYLLFRNGPEILFKNNEHLSTGDCLSFLCDTYDPGYIHVAYYFDYDVTMILRDLPSVLKKKLLNPSAFGATEYRHVWWGPFQLEYIPHKYIRIKREEMEHGITISDVGSFFQCKFTKALTDWDVIDPETLKIIETGKAAREYFEIMTDTEIEYNRLEVLYLEELMTRFREVCEHSDIIPAKWQGPAWISRRMMQRHQIPKRKNLQIPLALLAYVNDAYYGGRAELTRIGNVKNVYEYDINSAYPRALLELPCLTHGRWEHGTGQPPKGSLYCASVHFKHSQQFMCSLPIRDKKSGIIKWPVEGNGTYWSWEIEADPECSIVEWRDYWLYHRECDCHPFNFVPEIYAERKALGKSTKGYPLKLGMNSLYGICCQSVGAASYANPIWGGLITAYCRAEIIKAYSTIDRENVVMIATDGLYTTEPVNLSIGDGLGQWEVKQHPNIFFVQPGIYFIDNEDPTKRKQKTRGISMSAVAKVEPEIRQVFADWLAGTEPGGQNFLFQGMMLGRFPWYDVPIHIFIGMKLAESYGKSGEAGKWKNTTRKISFDFHHKRMYHAHDAECVYTRPLWGSADLFSTPYGRDIGAWREDQALFEAQMEAQPDFFPFTPAQERLL